MTSPDISESEIKALHAAGVRGLRFNVVDRRDNKNQVPADMLRGVAKRIAPLGWHIEMLVNLDEAGDFAPLLGIARRAGGARPSRLSEGRRRDLGRRRAPSPICCGCSTAANAGSS